MARQWAPGSGAWHVIDAIETAVVAGNTRIWVHGAEKRAAVPSATDSGASDE